MSAGLMAVIPALPLYIEERFGISDPGAVAAWTAVVFGAAPLTAAFFGPLWGALGDRIGRKAMVLRAQVAIASALVLMPLAPDPYWLAALRVFQGMFAGYVAPAMALVSADAPADRQGRVISRLQLALALGLAVGPLVGAEVAVWASRSAVFWCAGGLALLSALPVLLLVQEDIVQEDRGRRELAPDASQRGADAARRASVLRGLRGDAAWVLGHRVLLAVLLVIFLLRLGLNMAEPFTALLVRELGVPPWLGGDSPENAIDRTTALAFSLLAAGQLLFTTAWGRLADRAGPARCLGLVTFALAVTLALMSMVASIESYLTLRSAAAVFMAGTTTLAYSAVSRRVPTERRALAFALVQSCMQLGLSLGPMLGGALVPGLGLRGLFAVGSGVLAVAGTGMFAVWLARRRSS